MYSACRSATSPSSHLRACSVSQCRPMPSPPLPSIFASMCIHCEQPSLISHLIPLHLCTHTHTLTAAHYMRYNRCQRHPQPCFRIPATLSETRITAPSLDLRARRQWGKLACHPRQVVPCDCQDVVWLCLCDIVHRLSDAIRTSTAKQAAHRRTKFTVGWVESFCAGIGITTAWCGHQQRGVP